MRHACLFEGKIVYLEDMLLEGKEALLEVENDEDESEPSEEFLQTFNIKCKKRLSRYAKSILLSWDEKPFYYANEDILYLLKSNLLEQDFLLKTLHSMAIFLQNATSASFFDISIDSVTFTPEKTDQTYNSSEFVESITFKLQYAIKLPPEKTEVPW